MLTFTTTEPHGMFSFAEDSTPLIPQREFAIKNDGKVSLSVYLHGEAQNEAGFDIPLLVEGELDISGEYDGMECEVELPSPPDEYARPRPNRKIPCLLFTWDTQHPVTPFGSSVAHPKHMGLIAAKDDEAALRYARQARAEKKWML